MVPYLHFCFCLNFVNLYRREILQTQCGRLVAYDFPLCYSIVADLVDAGDTTDTASIASTAPTQSSVGLVITLRGPRKAKQQRYPKPIDGPSSKKGMGVRKWRRYQNSELLTQEIVER